MAKDKKQVIGEEITDDVIKVFLMAEPADDTPASLHKLIKAYRGLRPDDFKRFLGFFLKAGHSLNERDAGGNTFLDLIQTHRQAQPYIEAVKTCSLTLNE